MKKLTIEELTIEEKAQRYDEAIERAKKWYNKTEPDSYTCIVESIFPELKESEDEKIRKEIIGFIKNWKNPNNIGRPHDFPTLTRNEEQCNKYIAWLEKQEGCECIKKDWLEHIKQSWYKEGFIDGKYSGGTSKEWTINDAATLNELIDFLENGTAKLQHDLTRYANWLKIQFTPIEKQGEHTDKVEPKFKVGDWIIHNDNKHIPIKIIEKIGMYYRIVDTNNYHHNIFISCINKNYRLWTIKDAKDGDVLVSTWKGHSYIYIFKEIEGNAIVSHVYYYPEFDAIDMGVINMDNTPTVPATKEQRDSLMKAMTDAGYTFDFEKKELKKIEQNHACSEEVKKVTKWVIDYIGNCPNESFDFYGGVGKEAVLSWLNKLKDILPSQPNQEWNEEDKYNLSDIEAMIHTMRGDGLNADRLINWLKYRVQPQPNQEWSEEDEAKLKSILFHIEDVENKDVINWLKTLKDRVQPQPKQEWKQENTGDLTDFENAMMHIGGSFFGQHAGLDPNDTNAIKEQANLLLELVPSKEWSKEDEKMIETSVSNLTELMNRYGEKYGNVGKCIDWLKSIKDKVQHKQLCLV